MTGWMWFLVTVLGVAALGLMLAYGLRQSQVHRQDRNAVRRTEEATERLYDREQKRSTE